MSNASSESKSDHFSSIGVIFKARNQNRRLFGQFSSDFDGSHVILTKIVEYIFEIKVWLVKLVGLRFTVEYVIEFPRQTE